jgi:hypothetical protein
VPADSGPIIGSDRSMPSEITTGSATGVHPGNANSRPPRIR